ncbi:MAG: TRAP transporter large permease [Desulfovibrio sp.]|uniref:TRAP transporter large permease n=1 Tax=Desulfovibrio sp. 7SRBS1 TaxID=3378064 RepID=UPI003B42142A
MHEHIQLIFILFPLFILAGMPIAFVLGSIPLIYIFVTDAIPLVMIPQAMFNGVDSFVLLSIMFFILAGSLMNKIGLTHDLIAFADLIVGRIRGSLAQINVLVSILFAGLTGAAVADAAAIGSMLIPAMEKEGYSKQYAAAVTATSSVIGPIIPPSIIMVIYAAVTGLSVGDLFIAGIVPGLLIGVALMVLCYYYARKENHPCRTTAIPRAQAFRIVRKSVAALLVPVIIIGGILSGMFTPTEAAAIACVYSLVLGVIVFRTVSLKAVYESFKEAAVVASMILLIISAAKLFCIMMAMEGIPQTISSYILNVTDNKFIFLLFVNLLLIFMGMILETGANVLLLVPILMPIAMQYGIDPLHFAIVVLVNLNIGLATPPLGVVLFTIVPIAKTSFESIIPKLVPFLLAMLVVLFAMTYIPDLVLFVPKLLGYGS